MRIDFLPANPTKKQVRRYYYRQLRKDMSRWKAKRGAKLTAAMFFPLQSLQLQIGQCTKDIFDTFCDMLEATKEKIPGFKELLGGDLGST